MLSILTSAIAGILVIILVVVMVRPKREVQARSTKSKVYVSRKQNEVKELRIEKRRCETVPSSRTDVLVPPNLRKIQDIYTLSDNDDNEDSKIETKRKGRWYTFGDDDEEEWNENDDEDYIDSNSEDSDTLNSKKLQTLNEDEIENEFRVNKMNADLRARKDVIRKQREDAEYLCSVAAAVVERERRLKNEKKSSIGTINTTKLHSNIHNETNDGVTSIVKNVLLEMNRRKEDTILAVRTEEARRVALVAAQAAKIAYSKATRHVRVAVSKKNRDIKAKKIQKAKAQALSEMAFREPGKIAVRLMHVFEGVRNEYQYLEKSDSDLASRFPSVRYKNGLELNISGSFKIRTFKSTKFGQVFKPLNMMIGTIMEPEEMIQILKDLCVMISAVRKTNNDVLFRALCVNVVNKILKKAASNQKCSRNLGVASAFLCMRFPVLYGFFTAQLIRECPFFGPICIHTLSNVGPCACGNKRIHGFVDSTRTWQSCHKHDLVACHGLPRGHGPSPLDSFTSGSKNCVHQSKITPGDHEIVETSLTMFYAGLLTGVNRMGSQPQLYQLYFEKRYGLALSDGSISNRVSIEIAKLERSLGANVVEILGNLNGRAISCDAYDLHTLGSKRDAILANFQTDKGTGFGLPYGKTRIWQWTAFWVTHLVDPKFEVPYILPGMMTVFLRETKNLMLNQYGRQYRRLLNTLRKGLESRIDHYDVRLKKCGLCFVSSSGQPILDFRKSQTAYADVAIPLFELCSS